MRKLDVFISHGWRRHNEWEEVVAILDGIEDLTWRNFSVPWHDPALHPSTEIGLNLIDGVLTSQVVGADVCLIIADLYKSKSTVRWVNRAIEVAKESRIPLLYLYKDEEHFSGHSLFKGINGKEIQREPILAIVDEYSVEAEFKYV